MKTSPTSVYGPAGRPEWWMNDARYVFRCLKEDCPERGVHAHEITDASELTASA